MAMDLEILKVLCILANTIIIVSMDRHVHEVQTSSDGRCDCHLNSAFTMYELIHAGMQQGMLSPGLVPPPGPGPSPLPHFGTAFGSWESPPYSPTSYRQYPASGIPHHSSIVSVHTHNNITHVASSPDSSQFTVHTLL